MMSERPGARRLSFFWLWWDSQLILGMCGGFRMCAMLMGEVGLLATGPPLIYHLQVLFLFPTLLCLFLEGFLFFIWNFVWDNFTGDSDFSTIFAYF